MQTNFANAPPKRIVLAVDPYNVSAEVVHRVALGLGHLYGPSTPTVQPIFVLTPDATPLPLEWFDDVVPKLKAEAESRLLEVLQENQVLRFAEPHVIVDDRRTLQIVVDRINDCALRSGADLVVIPTARKTPLRRLFLGSFSEAMLQRSSVPILTIGPDVQREVGAKRTCLAAIDISSNKLTTAVDQIIELGKASDVDIVFLYATSPSLKQMSWAGGPLLINPRSLLHSQIADEHQRALSKIEEITKCAASQGCRVSGRLMISTLPTSEAIIHAAKAERATLVALASQSTPLSWLASRSVARDVIRTADLPVWTLPSQFGEVSDAAEVRAQEMGRDNRRSIADPEPSFA